MKKTITILVLLAGVGLWASTCFVAVDETQFVIIKRFGRPRTTVLTPGLCLKWPLPIENVVRFDNRLQVFEDPRPQEPPKEYLTRDKKNVEVATATCWRIARTPEAVLAFLATVQDRKGAELRLCDMVKSQLNGVLGAQDFDTLISTNGAQRRWHETIETVRTACADRATDSFGIEIVDLRIQRLSFPAQNRRHVFDRMRAERERIAKQYRSEGEALSMRIIADAQSEQERILAEARAAAARIRGEADAEATRIYGAAYNTDPEFYRFTRTLQAYERGLDADTTLILPADAPFLRLLVDPDAVSDELRDPDPSQDLNKLVKMAKAIDNPNPRQGADSPSRRRRNWLPALVVIGLGAYLASGFFVQPDERAVIRRFGRIVEAHAEPGLHFAWPWPVGRYDKPRTRQVQRVTIGFDPKTRAAIAAGDLVAAAQSPETDVFTGDVNILKATMVAQYQISAADEYLTRTIDSDWLVKLAVRAVMIETIGGYSIESALTSAKAEIQNVTRERAQAMLDAYGCGIILIAVDLESIEPPHAIADAFRDVASAKKDREKQIDQAASFANQILPRAEGRAHELRADAESYRSRRVQEARGDADVFRALHAQYLKAPLVTRTRLLLGTLARVAERAKTYVLPPESDGAPLRLTIGQSGVN